MKNRSLIDSEVAFHEDYATAICCIKVINTQYMTNPTIAYPVKMEYGSNFSISGRKIMVKSGLERIFLKFFHEKAIFYLINLPQRKEEF